jgi:DNA-binding winged helix-turn-helix (wHTH) protein
MDPAERLLLREGHPVHVTTKAFDTLLTLIQGHGRLIEKSELMRTVWAENFVEEGNLTVLISMLRKTLGDEGDRDQYIQTVSKRGYRFVGDLREVIEPQTSEIQSIAVLPFRCLKSDAALSFAKFPSTWKMALLHVAII